MKKEEGRPDYAQRSGFHEREGGQDIVMRTPSMLEKAEILVAAATVSDARMLASESTEDLIVRVLGSNPAFAGAEPDERNRMAIELVEVFDTLDDDEASAAAELYLSIMERGTHGKGAWVAPPQMSQGMKEALSAIFEEAGKDEEIASLMGKRGKSDRQMPLLVAEHARAVVRAGRYDSQRPRLEEGIWHVDEDIAAKGRDALKAVFGIENTFAGCAEILSCVTKRRVDEKGVAGAIAEICEFMQGLRDAGAAGETQEAALSALAWFFDPDVTPTFHGLMLISEMGESGGEVIDPPSSLLELVRRHSSPP